MTSVRVEARRALVDLIRSTVTDPEVDVFYGLPGPENLGKRSAIWIGDIEGIAQERRLSNRGHRQDSWTMEVSCAAGPDAVAGDNQNYDDTDPERYQAHDEHVMEMVQLIDDMIATSLGSRLENVHGGTVCSVSNINGPNPRLYTNGAGSEATLTLTFTSRHSNTGAG
jgi:hypothetical protein